MRQTFRSASDRIVGVSLELATYQRSNQGELTLRLSERTTGEDFHELARITRASSEVVNDAYNEFAFESPVRVKRGQQLALELTTNSDSANAITWYMTPHWMPKGLRLSVNDARERGTAHFTIDYGNSGVSSGERAVLAAWGALLGGLLGLLWSLWRKHAEAPALSRLRARLGRMLDGDERSDAATPPFALCFVVAALVIAFKAPDSLANPQFWFEDAVIFFAQQQGHYGPQLFTSYASYLHTLPRLVAWVAHAFPYAYAPTVYNYGAWLLGAGALASLRHLRLGGLPFLVVLSAIALTPTNGEVFGTITGLQWLLQFYFMGMLARFARNEVSVAPYLRAATAFALGLTGPFGVFAALAALGMLVLSRLLDRRQPERAFALRWNLELTAVALAALIQVVCVLVARSPSNVSPAPVDLKSVLRIIGLVQLHAYGTELVSRPLFRMLLLGLTVVAFWCTPDRRSRLLLAGLLGFVLLEGVTVVRKFSGDAGFAELGEFGRGDRYYVPIKTLMVWQFALIAERLAGPKPWRRAFAFALVLLLPLPLYGHLLQKPAFPDLLWKDQARPADQGQAIDIDTYPPPLRVHLEGR
ncbi:MAG: hypothetical protein QM778_23090 [Myxococcales bacterium]